MKLTVRDIVVMLISVLGFALGTLVPSLFESCMADVHQIPPRNERMAQFGHTNAASTGTNGSVIFPHQQTPLYVIPEAVLIQTPIGSLLFAHEYHIQELIRMFPSRTLTNLVIWSK